LIAIVAVSGVALAATPEEWHKLYDHFGAGGASAFIAGGANLIASGWGLDIEFSRTLLAVMLVLFAGTTMDSGVRLQRYIIQEWGEIYKLPILTNNTVATLLAVAACLLIAFGAGGPTGDGGMIIWPLFGSTNQILASLTLLVLSVYLHKLGRPAWITIIPMLLVLVMAFLAALIQLREFYEAKNYLLVGIDAAVIIITVLVILEAVAALRHWKDSPQEGRAPYKS
jgi:carbon starvation protein